jgi:acyl-coenzyme A thioesterase PaaI-like protein
MDVTELPFNRLVGIKKSDLPEPGILELDDLPQYKNHLNTVHASAQFALAEACGGEFLSRRFGELAGEYVPVLRRAEIKYKKPASGKMYAKARAAEEEIQNFLAELKAKRRALITVEVSVMDYDWATTMSASLEWFVQQVGEP